jgi:hypothetical protein
MAKIQLPPKKDEKPAPVKAIKTNEKKIRDVIGKGGSTTKSAEGPDQEQVFKNFNIKILDSEIQTINELRERRPKARGQKRMGISLHDWIIEAVQEKIERERKSAKV